ncbi:MAG: hypothetical protein E5V92_01425 [Mesorhizobium sp.]|uniref:hypothetical protein n=1 Tax=unclassified Mesorhizobium TaxID=325217 RepID=UPI000F760914|nr:MULTISPECIES: hypothetical protein [unclassified Mesorhizobium]AZO74489.1 hypothetical protein EJ067_27565 [Mesorhizobium sp. M1D.F.Ca.ET.043.01.1.1]RWA96643.1 MAG: hypothetical protein EOQ32_03300 [Mesorhizobium sp.]RWE18193.1 MAG: hypothetical protein EOS61_00060 [Mesorhizobium sp.]TJW90704.1 MAG: hypothetical protein E5V92_01425 [Mesorhizobium sp.]
MDTYSEIVPPFIGWALSPGVILMLAATLPLMLLLKGRLLGYGTIAILIGAVALILFGIENWAGSVTAILAYCVLVSFALLSTWRRLKQIEDRLALVLSAIEGLEVAEERRQTYSAKRSRRKPAAGAIEQTVSAAATDNAGKETRYIPGPPWQELQALAPRPESAPPASMRPAGSNFSLSSGRSPNDEFEDKDLRLAGGRSSDNVSETSR